MKDWTFSISIKAGPCRWRNEDALSWLPNAKIYYFHLLFELFDTPGLKFVHEFTENHSILEDLAKVSAGKRFSHHSLHPLIRNIEAWTLFVWYLSSLKKSNLQNLLLLISISLRHFVFNACQNIQRFRSNAASVMNSSNIKSLSEKLLKSWMEGKERWRHRRYCLILSLICHVIEKPSILLGPGDYSRLMSSVSKRTSWPLNVNQNSSSSTYVINHFNVLFKSHINSR